MGPLQGIQDVADETCLNWKTDVLINFSLRWNYFFQSITVLQSNFYVEMSHVETCFRVCPPGGDNAQSQSQPGRKVLKSDHSQDKHVFVYLLGWILS